MGEGHKGECSMEGGKCQGAKEKNVGGGVL